MKKIISILVVTVMLAAVFGVSVSAADSVNVTVTISDGNGDIAVAFQNYNLSDLDNDGKITICDALTAADQEGFEAEETDWGLSIKKLCGVENGGSYGYMVNDQMAMSLTDELKDGDYLAAYVFQDPQGLSDSYAFFDRKTASLASETSDEAVELTLFHNAFDENWNLYTEPVAGADIYANGQKTGLKTDENGKVTISFEAVDPYVYYGEDSGVNPGEVIHSYAIITAKADGMTLDCGAAFFTVTKTYPAAQEPEESTDEVTETEAPTADTAEAEEDNGVKRAPQTGDAMIAVVAVMMLAGAAVIALRRREN